MLSRWFQIHLIRPLQSLLRSKWARLTAVTFTLFFVLPVAALAQNSPFDTGFTAIQSLFTGTIAKVASLVAIVIGGYTQEYLDASSPRSQQIRDYLERTGRSGKEAAEIAAHSTRDRKKIHSPGEVMAAHRKLAADFGHQAEAVVRAARDRSQHQEKPVNSFDRVQESLTFARDKNFEREAVVDERALIRDGLRRGDR